MDGLRLGLELYVEGQAMQSALQTSKPLGQGTIDSIKHVDGALVARAAMLRSLEALYRQFGALAEYDAATEVESAVADFIEAVKTYSKSVPPEVAVVGPAAAGWLASIAQGKQIQRASEEIRRPLSAAVAVMKREQETYTAIAEVNTVAHSAVARELFVRGIGQPHQILRAQLGSFGLDYSDKDFAALGPTEKNAVREAIVLAVERRASNQVNAFNELFARQIDVLAELEKGHVALEQGEVPNLQHLTAYLARIRAIVEQLNQLRAERGETTQDAKAKLERILEFLKEIQPILSSISF